MAAVYVWQLRAMHSQPYSLNDATYLATWRASQWLNPVEVASTQEHIPMSLEYQFITP